MNLQQGQVAVVTGGAAGIGFALATAFAARGLRVAIADRDELALQTAERQLRGTGADVLAVPTDIADRASVCALREQVLARFGQVDVICNNAGVYHAVTPIWTIDPMAWQRLFSINYWGVVHGIQEFVPLLLAQGSGHVVTTASMSGLTAVPGMADYGSSKHGIVALNETLRADLDMAGASAIGVTLICPAVVRTSMGERAVGLLGSAKPADGGAVAGSGPNLASVLDPDDVAQLALQGMETERLYVTPTPGSKARFVKRIGPILDAFDTQPPPDSQGMRTTER